MQTIISYHESDAIPTVSRIRRGYGGLGVEITDARGTVIVYATPAQLRAIRDGIDTALAHAPEAVTA